MQKRLIWLVEDETSIADTLIYALQTDGFEVEWFPLGQPLLARLEQTQPDFLILDVGLPDISGFELCKQVRTLTDTPLMFLTARSEEIDRLIGLEIGADDYVAKPFSPREVCARVRVILRRSQPNAPQPNQLLVLDEERARICFHDTQLCEQENPVHALLSEMRRLPEAVRKKTLLYHYGDDWDTGPYDDVPEASVDEPLVEPEERSEEDVSRELVERIAREVDEGRPG